MTNKLAKQSKSNSNQKITNLTCMQEEDSFMLPELFALDDESSCESTCSLTRSAGSIDTVDYDSLDQCLDAHSLARSIQSLKVPDMQDASRVRSSGELRDEYGVRGHGRSTCTKVEIIKILFLV